MISIPVGNIDFVFPNFVYEWGALLKLVEIFLWKLEKRESSRYILYSTSSSRIMIGIGRAKKEKKGSECWEAILYVRTQDGISEFGADANFGSTDVVNS